MTEFLIFCVLAFIGWGIYRVRKPRRSPESIRREKTGNEYRPDPMAHLDVKANDRSIVRQSAEMEPVQFLVQTSLDSSAEFTKPKTDDYQFEIEYVDRNGKATKRRIAWVHHEPDGDDTILHAYCELAQADRKFRSSRIQSCKNLWTGRQIKDLGRYFRSGSYRR